MIFGKRILAAAAAVVCIGTAGGLVQAEDQIGQGISIEGIDVSGMTYDEAKSVVQQKVSDMMNSTIKVQINDESVDASAVDFGLQWKNRNVVQEAVDKALQGQQGSDTGKKRSSAGICSE